MVDVILCLGAMFFYITLSKPTFRYLFDEAFKMLLFRKPIWSKQSQGNNILFRGIQVLHPVALSVEAGLRDEHLLRDDGLLLHALRRSSRHDLHAPLLRLLPRHHSRHHGPRGHRHQEQRPEKERPHRPTPHLHRDVQDCHLHTHPQLL